MPTYSVLTTELHTVYCEYELEAIDADAVRLLVLDKEVNYHTLTHADGTEGEKVVEVVSIKLLEA